jgi:hypothetical protein|nr:hypothetical protein [Neorhizobium tomejilense]
MADLPPHLKAVQEMFRPRMEAQTARMRALQEQALADELANANPVEELSAEETLKVLSDEISKH